MIVVKTNFSNISSDSYLRFDEKYHLLEKKCKYNIFNIPENKQIPLSDILKEEYLIFEYLDEEYKGIPTGQEYIDVDGDIIDFQPVTVDNHPKRLKYALDDNHILLSSLRLAKSPALLFENTKLDNYVFSNGYYSFAIKNGWNIKYVLYLLRTKKIKKVLDNNIYRGIGISSYKSKDLLRIPVYDLTINKQNEAVEKILPLEKQINKLKAKKQSIQKIIDSVLKNEFHYDYDTFEKIKLNKSYNSSHRQFSNNPDLRFSPKFHRPAGEYVMRELTKQSDKKIKHFISEPIVLGSSISPSDFDKNGSAYYISMATIKTLDVVLDETQLVSNKYYKDNVNKSIKNNDIIIARSGVAIGKTALVKDDFDGIFADFTMRIRLDKEKCNPQFVYYYLRSKYIQYMIEVYKKGLQNQNIFPIVMKEFPMPNITLNEQNRIVKKIQAEINKQSKIEDKISKIRNEIEEIILKSMA